MSCIIVYQSDRCSINIQCQIRISTVNFTSVSTDCNIICSNIEDQSDNATRFLIVGNNNLPISGNDKTSILISASDTAGGVGVLYNLLKPLADYGVSMTRIESRPSKKKKWEYVFFIDLEGHANEPHITKALSKLKNNSSLFKILGAYPKTIY